MTKVEVVNRRVIDGKERKRGEVIDVTPGRARDLINSGKAVAHAEAPKPAPVISPAAPSKPKEAK